MLHHPLHRLEELCVGWEKGREQNLWNLWAQPRPASHQQPCTHEAAQLPG